MRDLGEISDFLKGLSFKKKFIGGIDEADVLKKLSELEDIYEANLDKHIIYYKAIIADREAKIKRLENGEK